MGYSFDKLKPFVRSIKQTSYDGDVCLLTNKCPAETADILKQEGVLSKKFKYRGKDTMNSWSKYWKYIRPFLIKNNNSLNRAILKEILPLQTVRFLYYNDYLKKNREQYSHVLLTDVRDVVFQEDPFILSHENTINCYEEYLYIKDEKQYNQVWIKMLFGEEVLTGLLEHKILCSGTIIGPIDKMIELLDDFEKVLINSFWIAVSGSDQGAYNYLIYTQYKDSVKFNPFGTGEVLTVHNDEETVFSIKNNKLFYSNGELIPVVHQYYRSKKISSLVDTLYNA